MIRKILVCLSCKGAPAIFKKSAANKAPRWTGKIGDPPEKRKEIGEQDDLRDFRREHRRHKVIMANLG